MSCRVILAAKKNKQHKSIVQLIAFNSEGRNRIRTIYLMTARISNYTTSLLICGEARTLTYTSVMT
ncbi:hypothetical protein SAMN05661012_06284 [Chitinophaga sancti]|uniref:Uncharacterized protein n=1 Tax=Chitinophaga sancti TaxID=1004 RepID=A0A1K1SXQ0_9BACT|nr:hypothetical protein SAMN05661012_06284 [Chitinophaga sancti]